MKRSLHRQFISATSNREFLTVLLKYDDVRKIRIAGIAIDADIEDIKKKNDISAEYEYISKRKYRENTILKFSGKVIQTITLTVDEYKSYLYDVTEYFYVFKKEEVGYWRKAYALQDMIYEEFNGKIENCGYYKLRPSTMLKINSYQVDHDESSFDLLSDDECYVYHEWY